MSIEKDNVNQAILIVLIAGTLWSFGALTVRFIEDAHLVPWQYLFFRGCTIFLFLNIYLFFKKLSVYDFFIILRFCGSTM